MNTKEQWIVQRCINAFTDDYQNWPGYCEKLLNKSEMKKALDECNKKWPTLDFRGHRVVFED